MRSAQIEFDTENRQFISEFLKDAEKTENDISHAVISTIAQFVSNLRTNVVTRGGKRGWVNSEELIDAQIEELRRCIVDLAASRDRLTQGEIVQ